MLGCSTLGAAKLNHLVIVVTIVKVHFPCIIDISSVGLYLNPCKDSYSTTDLHPIVLASIDEPYVKNV